MAQGSVFRGHYSNQFDSNDPQQLALALFIFHRADLLELLNNNFSRGPYTLCICIRLICTFFQASDKFSFKYCGQFIQTVRIRTPTVLQADTLLNGFKNIAFPLEL